MGSITNYKLFRTVILGTRGGPKRNSSREKQGIMSMDGRRRLPMGVVATAFGPDNRPQIHVVPEGEQPAKVVTRNGLDDSAWFYCDSEAQAKEYIRKELVRCKPE